MLADDFKDTHLVITRNKLGIVLSDYNTMSIDIFSNDKEGLEKLIKYIAKELEQELFIKIK